MNKLFLRLLSMTLLLSPAYAQIKTDVMPLNTAIQEVHAATLENSENEKPKVKKASKKAKKSHKANKK